MEVREQVFRLLALIELMERVPELPAVLARQHRVQEVQEALAIMHGWLERPEVLALLPPERVQSGWAKFAEHMARLQSEAPRSAGTVPAPTRCG